MLNLFLYVILANSPTAVFDWFLFGVCRAKNKTESTVVKRKFGTEDDQIVLYTTMMGVLRGQLIDHSNRSIGCLDFDHLVETGRDDNDLKRFLDLFAIEEQSFRNTYQPPAVATNATVSPYLQIYMDTFVETSQAVWETCTAVSHYGWFN
jgi:hypothetical protein